MTFFLLINNLGVPVVAQQVMNRTSIHGHAVRSLASLSGLGILCCRELWCKLAAAALIQLLAQELLYATGAAPPPQKAKKIPNLRFTS